MALAKSYGAPVVIDSMGPHPLTSSSILNFQWSKSVIALDAAGEAVAFIGRVFLAAGTGSKTISAAGGGQIHCTIGSTTFSDAGSSIDVGIQDTTADTANPDETFDVSATLVGGTDTLTASTIKSIPMESGSKTISHNQLIALVFHMTARGGSDSVIFANMGNGSGSFPGMPFGRFRSSAGAWSGYAAWPNVLIEFDDGSFGWFAPYSFKPNASISSQSYNSGSASFDEYGSRLAVPWSTRLAGLILPLSNIVNGGSDFEVCLYRDIDGTPTLLNTAESIDASDVPNGAVESYWYCQFSDSPVLLPDVEYGWTIRPTTANAVTIQYFDFTDNALMASLPFGGECYRIKRNDNTGVFTHENTLHVPFALVASHLPDSRGGANYQLGI